VYDLLADAGELTAVELELSMLRQLLSIPNVAQGHLVQTDQQPKEDSGF